MGASAYNAGKAFSDALSQSYQDAKSRVANAIFPGAGAVLPVTHALAPVFGDFVSGATGGAAPLSDTATVHLPPARPVATVVAAPAAAKPAAAKPGAAAKAVDPTAALGNLSFRQLLALSQASENLAPRGSAPRVPTSSDAAGGMLTSIYQGQFQNAMAAAGKDPAKQQAAIDAFEKKVMPIALKGNTADEYIYGQTPGAQ